jgi:hypothetical protein
MISRTRKAILVSNIVLLAALIVIAQSHAGSAVGTWKLDTQKSDFGGLPAPRNMTVVVSEDSKTKVTWKASGTNASGKKISESYSGDYDGKTNPIKGSEMAESVGYTRNPDGTISSVTKDKSGTDVAHGTLTLSDDGKTITIKTARKGPNGDVSYTEVFTRVK